MGVWLEVGREGQDLAKIIFCGQSSPRFFHTAIVKIGDVQPGRPRESLFKLVLDSASVDPFRVPYGNDVCEGIAERRFEFRHAADIDFWSGHCWKFWSYRARAPSRFGIEARSSVDRPRSSCLGQRTTLPPRKAKSQEGRWHNKTYGLPFIVQPKGRSPYERIIINSTKPGSSAPNSLRGRLTCELGNCLTRSPALRSALDLILVPQPLWGDESAGSDPPD
jgi:hypothetical protein